MYGMDIHTTIKTFLAKGTSRRKIATQMGLHRKVIKRIEQGIATDYLSPPFGSRRPFFIHYFALKNFYWRNRSSQIEAQRRCEVAKAVERN